MTDTTTCPNCSAAVPTGAGFCTSCGHRMAPAAEAPATEAPATDAPAAGAPPPPAPAADETRIETPGLNDSTQVLSSTPPAEPWAPAPTGPTPSAWETPAAPAAPEQPAWQAPPAGAPAPPAWGEAPAAPAWGEVAAPAPAPPETPPWQQPAGAPGAPPAWGQQPAGAPPGAWGAPAPAPGPAAATAGSPLGGLATLAGSILALAGVFSGWVTLRKNGSSLPTDATISMWSFASGDEVIKSNDPYIIVALAVVGILVGVLLFTGKSRPIARIAAVAVGVGIIATAALDWSSIASLVSDDAAFQAASGEGATAKTAIGFFLAIAGGIVAAVGAVLPAKKA